MKFLEKLKKQCMDDPISALLSFSFMLFALAGFIGAVVIVVGVAS